MIAEAHFCLLQCVAVCCSVLWCVRVIAVCCSVLQCVAVKWLDHRSTHLIVAVCCSMCCSILQVGCNSMLQCVSASCSVLQWNRLTSETCAHLLQCVAVRCSMMQCVALYYNCVAVCCSGETKICLRLDYKQDTTISGHILSELCVAVYCKRVASVLQVCCKWAVVCCGVIWCVAVCYSALQVCRSVLQQRHRTFFATLLNRIRQYLATFLSVLCFAVCCSALQVCCSVLQRRSKALLES